MSIRAGTQVHEFEDPRRVHRELAKTLEYARVWGRSVPAAAQHVGRDHLLADRDVVELHV